MGLAVGMIGVDPQSGSLRWTFGQLYLWDGIPLVPVTLGIFAIPEIVDLVIKARASPMCRSRSSKELSPVLKMRFNTGF